MDRMARAIVKESGKDVDMPDQEEIVDGSGVGDDELHPSKSQASKELAQDGARPAPPSFHEFLCGLAARGRALCAFDGKGSREV
jgi:hypothetical protein